MLCTTQMHTHNLPRRDRLTGQINIDALFANGRKFTQFPLRVIWLIKPDTEGVAVLFSVAKKRFRHAVDRNRVKRLLRATYRAHRLWTDTAATARNCGLHIAFVMLNDQMPDYAQIDLQMETALQHIANQMHTNN